MPTGVSAPVGKRTMRFCLDVVNQLSVSVKVQVLLAAATTPASAVASRVKSIFMFVSDTASIAVSASAGVSDKVTAPSLVAPVGAVILILRVRPDGMAVSISAVTFLASAAQFVEMS